MPRARARAKAPRCRVCDTPLRPVGHGRRRQTWRCPTCRRIKAEVRRQLAAGATTVVLTGKSAHHAQRLQCVVDHIIEVETSRIEMQAAAAAEVAHLGAVLRGESPMPEEYRTSGRDAVRRALEVAEPVSGGRGGRRTPSARRLDGLRNGDPAPIGRDQPPEA